MVKEPSLVEFVKDGAAAGEHLFLVDTSNPVFELGCQGHAVAGQAFVQAPYTLR